MGKIDSCDTTEEAMDNIEIFKEKISDSAKVLIGIGEEFSTMNIEEYKQSEEYIAYNELMKNENMSDEDQRTVHSVLIRDYINNKMNLDDNIIYKAYKNLYELIKDKDYFIISMNYDNLIDKAGFDAERIVKPCGSWDNIQCNDNCTNEISDSTAFCEKIITEIRNRQIPALLECEKCKGKMVFNTVEADKYCEVGYLMKWEKYMKWLSMTINRDLCISELGVGFKYPTVIRWPFEKTAFFNNKSSFFRVNESFPQMTQELSDKGISIHQNAKEFLNILC